MKRHLSVVRSGCPDSFPRMHEILLLAKKLDQRAAASARSSRLLQRDLRLAAQELEALSSILMLLSDVDVAKNSK